MSITITDQFCGAGGSSQGASYVDGVEVKLAMNHWPLAIESHNTNFPDADHACCDVASTDPRRFPATDILITSPECTSHSYASGRPKNDPNLFDPNGDIAAEKSRATMWDVPRFAEAHNYKIIIVENVVEAVKWGPKQSQGALFESWRQTMVALGYDSKVVSMNSMIAPPTPQSRDRIYVVFWQTKLRAPNLEFNPIAYCPTCAELVHGIQTFKKPISEVLAGRYGQQYYYRCPTCATKTTPAITPSGAAIDWSLVCPRIGDRKRPLKPATIKRIERGLAKLENRPMVVPLSRLSDDSKIPYTIDEPFATQTTRQESGLVVNVGGNTFERGEYARVRTTDEVHMTQACSADRGLVVEVGGPTGQQRQPRTTDDLFKAVTTDNHRSLVIPGDAAIIPMRKNTDATVTAEGAMHTVTAGGNHHGLVIRNNGPKSGEQRGKQGHARDTSGEPLGTATTVNNMSLLLPYNGRSGDPTRTADEPASTMTTVDPGALIDVPEPVTPDVDDCGFRMLEPHEIGAAMAFDSDYTVLGTKRERVKQYGNAVTPPVMRLLIERCVEVLA